eukprot:1361808-Amorphochlora_amoeboformis.AAC.2
MEVFVGRMVGELPTSADPIEFGRNVTVSWKWREKPWPRCRRRVRGLIHVQCVGWPAAWVEFEVRSASHGRRLGLKWAEMGMGGCEERRCERRLRWESLLAVCTGGF